MPFEILKENNRTYLDHNATSPLAVCVRKSVVLWLENWGNPSSIHQSGRGPKLLMREARKKIARSLGVHPLEIIFTSGGTEANNLALVGVFEASPRRHFLVSEVEHPSVIKTAEYLRSRGARVDFIPVNRRGEVDLQKFAELVTEDTALVSMMLANNETGTIFPVKEMAQVAHAKGALFHSDCVQALGKIPVELCDLGVDIATFSGHKFYALKGCGFLYSKRGLKLGSLIHGGGQERHRRGGTENLLAIASLGKMFEFIGEVSQRASEMRRLRDQFEARITRDLSGVQITAGESVRLPGTSNLVIAGVDGETLLMSLDMLGFSVSTGAACSSGSSEPSPVLQAMGLSRNEAQSSLRIGLGWGTSHDEIESFTQTLIEEVTRIRRITSSSILEPVNVYG